MMSQKKLPFYSLFVDKNRKAKSYFHWKEIDCKIEDAQGLSYFSLKKVKAPEAWSQTAVDIAASKYFRKKTHDPKQAIAETSIEQLIERIGQGLATALKQSGILAKPSEQKQFIEEVKFILYSQKGAFNSPVWFNLGLAEAYGVTSKSHHYAWDFKQKKVKEIFDAYERPQCSACFIQSVEDSLESIFDLIKNEAKLFKYGSGSGTNFSNLRSKYEDLSTGGTSSGLIAFLDVLDKAAGAIKSGGVTRRAAKMVCLDLDHPEVLDFIQWKVKEEKKAHVLQAAGYDSSMDGEISKTLSGQNANHSLRVPDRFMKMLGQNKMWSLKARVNQRVLQKISVDELWAQICEAAWQCADPGLQFDDTINRFHTCASTGSIQASNPCSEYMFLNDSACNLASLNLVSFLDEALNFKEAEFTHAAKILFMAQECLIDFSSYPTPQIAQNSHDYRPLGLGFANLGAFLMKKGIPYDSNEGRAWAGYVTALMTGVAYQTSAEMAAVLGPFVGYQKNKKSMLQVLKKHQQALQQIDAALLPQGAVAQVKQVWQKVMTLAKQHGLRNAQATVIAPTGTIGLVMDCETTGIEPEFSLVKVKKLSGGGQIKMINQSLELHLKKLNYSAAEIQKIKIHLEKGLGLKTSGVRAEHLSIWSCAHGDLSLSAQAHLKMMAAVQPFISGAISKTVNLPATASREEVSETYKLAWKLGLKSVALYRDGSKYVQPLQSVNVNAQTEAAHKKAEQESPRCSECGHLTILESGCYRCLNCGTTSSCAS